ncbi:hypothetical protein AB0A63_33715 [Lentzea sp. NPDC042327]|uniref:hypothetical protein n=1 Tax=Lentzea sp. NPDC042327 TaxID=3154801 RepID=UPI0033C05CDB
MDDDVQRLIAKAVFTLRGLNELLEHARMLFQVASTLSSRSALSGQPELRNVTRGTAGALR